MTAQAQLTIQELYDDYKEQARLHGEWSDESHTAWEKWSRAVAWSKAVTLVQLQRVIRDMCTA